MLVVSDHQHIMEAGPSRVPAAPGEKTHVERMTNGASPSLSGSATPARPRFTPGASPYHESSQYRHWRYSRAGIAKLRTELNEKSREVTRVNVEAEKVRCVLQGELTSGSSGVFGQGF